MTARREARLLRAARQGDTGAVEELFSEFWPMCHRAAWLITRDADAAEDIAQEGFLAAMAALDRFDRARRLGPWLHTIVARRAIDHTRARALRREIQAALPDAQPRLTPSDPGLSARLLAALDALDDERRAIVVLRHLLDFQPREIAAMLDLPIGTVNSRMRRALDQLKATLEQDDG